MNIINKRALCQIVALMDADEYVADTSGSYPSDALTRNPASLLADELLVVLHPCSFCLVVQEAPLLPWLASQHILIIAALKI